MKCDWSILSYKLDEIELILFLKSCIVQTFVHQVFLNLLFQGKATFRAFHETQQFEGQFMKRKILS